MTEFLKAIATRLLEKNPDLTKSELQAALQDQFENDEKFRESVAREYFETISPIVEKLRTGVPLTKEEQELYDRGA